MKQSVIAVNREEVIKTFKSLKVVMGKIPKKMQNGIVIELRFSTSGLVFVLPSVELTVPCTCTVAGAAVVRFYYFEQIIKDQVKPEIEIVVNDNSMQIGGLTFQVTTK